MRLSVVIPSYNEAANLQETITTLIDTLQDAKIEHEILVVDDNSSDGSDAILHTLSAKYRALRCLDNPGPHGFGYAIRYGLDQATGDCMAIMMADLSDSPRDLVRFYRTMVEGGYDCVFGNRWVKGGVVIDYPITKKILNRFANNLIRLMMNISYGDTTNAFKLYRSSTIEGLRPFLSPHFNLTIELPLKAIIRGYSYTVLPNSWRNRQHGESKLQIREMGSRYFFILIYCLIEKYFSKGDFKKKW